MASGSASSGSRRTSRLNRKSIKGGRKGKSNAPALTIEDVEFLKKNTRYDEAEIKEWYKGFKVDCPDGQLTKTQILDMYAMILPVGNAKVFVDQIFRIFDKDGNGSIDFKASGGKYTCTTKGLTLFRYTMHVGIYDGHRHDRIRIARGEAKVGHKDSKDKEPGNLLSLSLCVCLFSSGGLSRCTTKTAADP